MSSKPEQPPVKVKLTTGGGHKAITPAMVAEATNPPAAPKPQPPAFRRRPRTSEAELDRLRRAWVAVEEQREKIEKEWPPDITRPRIALKTSIDWDGQPPIPAEKIDWSRQGEPLRVRLTLGAMLTAISVVASLIGSAAYFYWQVTTHVASTTAHLPTDGIPWGVREHYESKSAAEKARKALQASMDQAIKDAHEKLRSDLVVIVSPKKRRR